MVEPRSPPCTGSADNLDARSAPYNRRPDCRAAVNLEVLFHLPRPEREEITLLDEETEALPWLSEPLCLAGRLHRLRSELSPPPARGRGGSPETPLAPRVQAVLALIAQPRIEGICRN